MVTPRHRGPGTTDPAQPAPPAQPADLPCCVSRYPPSSDELYDDEGLDPEGPSADDLDRFGDEQITCWNCGADYYDQLERCPHCNALPRNPSGGMPAWMWVVATAGIVAFLFVFVF